MIRVKHTETNIEYVVKEYVVDQERLDEFGVTEEQLLQFIEDNNSVDDDIHDIIREMIFDMDYNIYDEETHFDGEEWGVFEDD